MTELENKPHQGDPWETGERRRTPPTGFSGPTEGPSAPADPPVGGGGESYITGVLGAFLGAIVGALPTLLTGLFGFVSGWLALLIPFGARKGYQMFHGPRKTGFAFALILGLSVLASVGVCCWLIWPYNPLEAGLAFFLIPIVFSVIGAFSCRQKLRSYTEPEVLENLKQRAREENAGESARQAALYPGDKKWTTPRRVSMMLAMFPELGLMIGLLLCAMPTESMAWIFASLGACVGLFAAMFILVFPTMGQLQGMSYLFLRTADGRLWRVMINRLNAMDTYRFTHKNGFWTALTWDRLDEGERELLRASVLRATEALTGGQVFPGSALSRVVASMEEVTLRKEDRWCWKVNYRDGEGKARRMTIPKTYPDFSPAEGIPAPQGPMPYRWGMVALALAVTLAFAAGGWALGRAVDDPDTFGQQQEAIAVRVPENSTAYEHGGIRYQVDADFEVLGTGEYVDNGSRGQEVYYTVEVQNGCDTAGALEVLTAPISTARLKESFEGFRFLRTDGEETLVPLEGGKGGFNILTISYKDGSRWHTGVVLSPEGTLVTVTAIGWEQDETRTLGSILYILQSVEITLTEDNYQDMFQPAPDFDYIGVAYYRTADGLGFRDAYLPYGGELSYNEDGTAVTACAHGMEVTQTMTTAATAQEVVEAHYAALAGEGLDLYADGTSEIIYAEEYDIAYQQVAWFEEKRTRVRVAILYADTRGEGNYLSARIVYHPEAFDEEYPDLLAELGEVFALNLPQLDPMN